MRILYLTFYFEPDLSAGAFRNTALATELARQLALDGHVHVIAAQPNRYRSFSPPAPAHEQRGNLTIDRVAVPTHRSGWFDQIGSFGVYYRAAMKLAKRQPYDLIFASSSRLFTGLLGSRLSRRLGVPLVLDVRDLFRETILEMVSPPFRWLLGPVLRVAETYTFGQAHHINLVSEGFRGYFGRFGQASYSYFTNGIDDEFLDFPAGTPALTDPGPSAQPKTILYAGNIGAGQDLHRLIPEAARLLGDAYRFVIIGDGGTLTDLKMAVHRAGVNNVDIRSPVHRQMLPDAYRRADYLLLHLADLNAMKRVLPSKLFEYGATEKPILAGVAGYPAQFIRQHLTNVILFDPTDAISLTTQLRQTPYQTQARPDFIQRFNRQRIIGAMASRIRAVLDTEPVDAIQVPARQSGPGV